MKNKNHNMKKAAIESVFVWLVIFTLFVTILFFIINYTTIIRAKDTMDSLADYGANYVATNGIGDDLSSRMNSIRTGNFNAINADTGTICTTNVDNEFKVIFNVVATNTSLYFLNNQLRSRKVVFNQDGTGNTITCNMSVTIQQ